MVRKKEYDSKSIAAHTSIASNKDLRKHLESTFDAWMTWNNQGRHCKGNQYKTLWNIGHRIPCAAYNASHPDDLRRCHSVSNIFAQDARENVELGSKLPSHDVLMSLRHIWPSEWNNQLPDCSSSGSLNFEDDASESDSESESESESGFESDEFD